MKIKIPNCLSKHFENASNLLPKKNFWCREFRITAFFALLLISSPELFAQDRVVPTRVVDIGVVISDIAEQLDAGNQASVARLERLGFGSVAAEVQSLDVSTKYNFSSRTLIETLHLRAELADPSRGGDLFLRILYDDASSRSAQLATDPEFSWLRERFSSAEVVSGKNTISFSSMRELQNANVKVQLSSSVDAAIGKLADNFAEPHLSRVKFSMVKQLNLGKDGLKDFERAIARSKNRKEAIAVILRKHIPPPMVERAMRRILSEMKGGSAALSMDSELVSIMDELSNAENIPEKHRTIVASNDILESRSKQTQLARSVGLPGRVLPPALDASQVAMAAVESAENFVGSGISSVQPSLPVARASTLSNNYSTYTSSAFSGVSRSYRTAIRLPSLARGIAVGGELIVEIEHNPIKAFWMPNDLDPRFGRLFVELTTYQGWSKRVLNKLGITSSEKNIFAASRVLFTDSFASAAALLANSDGGDFEFKEGELLILMSMDPEANVDSEVKDELQEKITLLEVRRDDLMAEGQIEWNSLVQEATSEWDILRIERHMEDKYGPQIELIDNEISRYSYELPRGIVLHPSVYGREMAWTTARIDFWFNDLSGLSKEASQINNGELMPDQFRSIDIGEASTWQFYELDRVVKLGPPVRGASLIEVTPKLVQDHSDSVKFEKSLFGVSMFAYAEERPVAALSVEGESNFFQLPSLESELQPMLDWLSQNHHDFIRLNDFSESLSILRWLRNAGTVTTLIDMDGEPEALATPDRVVLGEGPGLPD